MPLAAGESRRTSQYRLPRIDSGGVVVLVDSIGSALVDVVAATLLVPGELSDVGFAPPPHAARTVNAIIADKRPLICDTVSDSSRGRV